MDTGRWARSWADRRWSGLAVRVAVIVAVLAVAAPGTGLGWAPYGYGGGLRYWLAETVREPRAYEWAVAIIAAVFTAPRWPIPALLMIAVLTGRDDWVFPAAVYIAYAAGRRLETWAVRAGVFGLAVLAMVLAAPGPTSGSLTRLLPVSVVGRTESQPLILAGLVLVLPGLLGATLGQQESLVVALRERNAYLEQVRGIAEAEARLAERTRIAEEMHDMLGHRLSLVSVYAGTLEMDGEPETRSRATLIRTTVAEAMAELRQILGVLRSEDADGPAGAASPVTDLGCRADVERIVTATRGAGLEVTLGWDGPDLDTAPQPVRRGVHRIVQEGLTNVLRHAPGATSAVTVVVSSEPRRVAVGIRNTPAGLAGAGDRPPAGGGRGIAGLRERVRLLGGSLYAHPTDDGGFLLHAELPLTVGEETTA
jgi:signal transduction histidine kinase